jgi:hypothetical protein
MKVLRHIKSVKMAAELRYELKSSYGLWTDFLSAAVYGSAAYVKLADRLSPLTAAVYTDT